MPTAITIKGLFKDEIEDGGEKPSSNTTDNSKKTSASGDSDIAIDPIAISTATATPKTKQSFLPDADGACNKFPFGIDIDTSESLPEDDLGVQGE
jgi:hypothetical protein